LIITLPQIYQEAREKAKEKARIKKNAKERARIRERTRRAAAKAANLLKVTTTTNNLIEKCKTFEPQIKASFRTQEESIDVQNHAKANDLRQSDKPIIILSTPAPTTTTWINDMDVLLRAQIHATHPTDPRNAAQAYATAMTSVIFTVLFSNATPPLPQPALNASKHLIHMATPLHNYPNHPPTAQALSQFIAIHYRIARTTTNTTTPISLAHATRITASSAIISLMLLSLSTVAANLSIHAATAITKATIIHDQLLLKSLIAPQ
jgi:hypothetical protein